MPDTAPFPKLTIPQSTAAGPDPGHADARVLAAFHEALCARLPIYPGL
mgnify:CR=1 FL=1